MVYRILLIDDDKEMIKKLSHLLSGHRIHIGNFNLSIEVDSVLVRVEPVIIESNKYWRFTDDTIRDLEIASARRYDLVVADYGLVDDEAKDILWGKDRKRTPGREEAKGRILTLKDLAEQYAETISDGSPNILLTASQVYLRSFASKLAFDILGPVNPDRVNATKAAFPNAKIDAFDTRNELYGGDAFYSFYKQKRGLEFYRQLVGHHMLLVVEKYILRTLITRAGRMRIRRSVLNIALFAGSVAVLGAATGYLAQIGQSLLAQKDSSGWWLIFAGLTFLGLGSLALSIYFESFARRIIRWIGPEEEFDKI